MSHLLETKNLTKMFGDFTANSNVNFWCDESVVTSLLGENGAGKSTLMKMIYGLYRPDAGEILFDGKKVKFKSPRDAISKGIQMVHQHFMIIDELTVAENIVMGKEPQRMGIYSKTEAQRLVNEISDNYGFMIDPKEKVGNLSVGEKQKVEIIKALYQGAKVLILDEPTAVLTPQETEGLFKVIRRLKADDKSVIIITHKLHETIEIADEIFVLRHGIMSGFINKEDTNVYQLSQMMVDHEPKEFVKEPKAPGKEALSVKNLTYYDKLGAKVLDELNLQVRSGEIYGMAGIEGNGQLEFFEILAGIMKGWSGEIEILNQNIKQKSVKEIIQMGVSCIHSDRTERGLLLDLDVKMNVLLGNQFSTQMQSKYQLLDYKKTAITASEIFEQYQVTPANVDMPLKSFSGGNQQKIIIGREFLRHPRLAIVAHPTRGVDIGVCEIIRENILELKRNGSAVLLITADFDELFQLSDRIGVMFEGKIVTEGRAEEYTPIRLGLYMGGGNEDEK